MTNIIAVEKDALLQVDAGELFTINRSDRDRLKAETLAKGFGLMGYDVLNLGTRELTYDADFLEKLEREGSFRFISANVRRKGEKKLFREPYVIHEVNGVRIGIIGIVLDINNEKKYRRQQIKQYIEHFTTDDPEEALTRYLPELRDKSDFVVLLSCMGLVYNKNLIKESHGFDVIISAQGHSNFTSPIEEDGKLLVHGSKRGTDVNLFNFTFDDKGTCESYTHEVRQLSMDVKMDPKVAILEKEFDRKMKQIREELMRERRAHPVQSRVYTGADACRICHRAAFQSWVRSPHARAFDTLEKEGKERSEECLRCHVTGYRERGGYGSEDISINLEGVQCEACHGRGSIHAENQKTKYGGVFQFTCRRCHNREFSPDFDYVKYMQRDPHFTPAK
jgi:hypothetical protein